jgi:hypothetical protein
VRRSEAAWLEATRRDSTAPTRQPDRADEEIPASRPEEPRYFFLAFLAFFAVFLAAFFAFFAMNPFS